MNKRIVGVFAAEHEASEAIEELKRHGCRIDDISIIARNKNDTNNISNDTGTQVPEGLTSGAATGGMLGGVMGLLMGIGALAIPGIGPIIAAGPLAATLAGAAVGAGAGGLVGGLIGLGIPKEEAESYDKYLSEGHILVMVDVEGESKEKEVHQIFRQFNALNASSLLEGKDDTSLDMMNSAPVAQSAADSQYDNNRSWINLNTEETEQLRAADQKDARHLAQATGTMDAMDTLETERIRNRNAEKLREKERLDEREMNSLGNNS